MKLRQKNIYIPLFISLFFLVPLKSQEIDPETLKSIMDLQGASKSKASDTDFKSFTQNNYSNTMRLLEQFDKTKEETLFYSTLNEERIELVAKLCSKDPRACYLVDEYREYKFDETPKTINDLKVFGIDIFSGYPLNLDSFNELPLPSAYQLKVGDVFEIDINGLKSFSDQARVDPMGEISIPGFGKLKVAGLNFEAAIELIKTLVDTSYPGSEVYVGLSQINPKKVFVLGNVLNPGGYGVNAFATVINSLITSGGFKDNSSLRNIKINNQGNIKEIDLYDFLVKGETNTDILLSDGDTLLVSGLANSVSVFGSVNRPAIYEIKKGETVEDVLKFSLGFATDADSSKITVKRRNALGSYSNVSIKSSDFNTFKIQNGDQIFINALSGEYLNNIDVIGSLRNPGQFEYSEGSTVSDFINIETDLLDSTYTPIALIKRFDSRTRSWKFVQFDLLNQNQLKKESLMPRDKIFIFSRSEVNFLSSYSVKTVVMGFDKEAERSQAEKLFNLKNLPANNDELLAESIEDSSEFFYYSLVEQPCFKHLQTYDQFFSDIFPVKLNALSESNSKKPSLCPDIFNSYPELLPYLLIQSAPVLGNVRLPGLYPVSPYVNAKDLLAYAGGILNGNNEDIIFEVSSNKPVSNIQFDQLLDESNIKFINVKISGKEAIYGYVTLHGEFLNPGTYSISRGETLLSVYERARGYSSLAYPLGGILTRESSRKKEKAVLEKAKKDIASVLTNAVIGGSFNQSTTDLVQLIQFISSMSEGEALGRIVTEMDEYKIKKNPALDILLEPGDNIYLPPITNTITIVGSVLNPITVPYRAGQNSADYINLAGGFSQTADKGRSYIIYPNGISKRIGRSFFGINSSNTLPGSTIIVPRKASAMDGMTFLRNITPILADLSITAASINAISTN